jgi:hypothetical protein
MNLTTKTYQPVGGVYAIDVDDLGTYYGETDNIKRRWTNHRKQLASGRHHNIKLRNAHRHLGPSKFHFRIIQQSFELDNSKQLRLQVEKALILNDPNNLNTAGSQAVTVTEAALPNKPIYRNKVIFMERIRGGSYARIRNGKSGPILGLEAVEGKWRMGLFRTDQLCRLTRINTRGTKS